MGWERMALATDNGVIVTEKSGGEWRETARGLAEKQATSVDLREGMILAGTTDGMFRSQDAGATWKEASKGLTNRHVRWLILHPEMNGRALAGTEPAAIFVSRDGGESWRECPEVGGLRDRFGWYLPYSPEAGCVRGFAVKGDRAYAAVEQGGVLISEDAGESWRLAKGSSGEPARQPEGNVHQDVHSIEVHRTSDKLPFAATGGGLYRSEDGGDTWVCLYECYCRAVCADPLTADHIILGPADDVGVNGRIEVSVDGGGSWQPASHGLGTPWPEQMVQRFVRLNEEIVAVLTNGRMLIARLDSLDWRPFLDQYGNVNAAAFRGTSD